MFACVPCFIDPCKTVTVAAGTWTRVNNACVSNQIERFIRHLLIRLGGAAHQISYVGSEPRYECVYMLDRVLVVRYLGTLTRLTWDKMARFLCCIEIGEN